MGTGVTEGTTHGPLQDGVGERLRSREGKVNRKPSRTDPLHPGSVGRGDRGSSGCRPYPPCTGEKIGR